MKNKRKLIYSFGTIVPICGVILATQACSVTKNIKDIQYKINNKSFSKNGLINYVKSFSTSKFNKIEDESERTWVIDTAIGEQVFNDPYELRKHLIKNIEEKYATVIPLDNFRSDQEKSEINELFANQIIPMEYKDGEYHKEKYDLNKGLIDIYEGKDDYPFFGSSTSKIDAKKSWMKFHNAYLYNGIYFKNKEDLEVYLNNTMMLKSQSALDNVRRYSFNFPLKTGKGGAPQNFKIITIPKNNNGTLNFDLLKNILSKQIEANSTKVISIKKSDGTFENFSANNLDKLVNNDNLLKYFKAWNIGTDRTSSYYAIDSKSGSRGDLFGNYFSKLPYSPGQENDRSGIMATTDYNPSWKKLSENAGEITKLPKDLSIENKLGTIMSLIFSSITSQEQSENKSASFIDVFTKPNLEIFINYLNDIRLNKIEYRNLGDQFLKIDSALRQGKKYNLFYSLPILRNWLISRLIDGGVNQVDLNKVNDIFIRGAAYLNIIANRLLEPLLKNTKTRIDFNKIYGFEDTSQNIYASPQTSIQEIIKNGGGVLSDAINIFLLSSSYITNNLIYDVEVWGNNEKRRNEYNQQSNYSSTYNQLFLKKIKEYKFPTSSAEMYNHELFKHYRFSSNNLIFKNNVWNFFKNVKHQYQDVNTKINEYNKKLYLEKTNLFNGFEDFVPQENQIKDQNNDDYLDRISKIVIGNVDINGFNSLSFDLKKMIKKWYKVSNDFIEKGKSIKEFVSKSAEKVKDFIDIIKKTDLKTNLRKMTNKTVSFISKSAGLSKAVSFVKKTSNKVANKVSSKLLKITSNPKFLKAASKVKKAVGKILKYVPYIEAILIAADIVKGIINFFSKKYIKESYAYKSTEGNVYIWNGGERVEQFLGLLNKETHGLKELELLDPIQLTATSKSVKQYYFDGKFYDSKKEALLEAFAKIKNNVSIETVQSFFTAEVTLLNKFAGYDDPNNSDKDNKGINWSNDTERDKIAEKLVKSTLLSKQKTNIDSIDPKKCLDSKSVYLKPMYTTSKGITYDPNKAINTVISNIITKIKPIFIFQKPKIIGNKLEIKPFSLPYPSYSIGSGIIDEKESKSDVWGLQYIYNPNIDNDFKQTLIHGKIHVNLLESSREIIDYYLNNLTKDFEVHHKKVYKLEALSKNLYSELKDNYRQIKVFLARSSLGKRKYFTNQASAIRWLGIEYNLRSVIPSIIFKKYIWNGFNKNENVEFDSETSLIKYVLDKYNLGAIYD